MIGIIRTDRLVIKKRIEFEVAARIGVRRHVARVVLDVGAQANRTHVPEIEICGEIGIIHINLDRLLRVDRAGQ